MTPLPERLSDLALALRICCEAGSDGAPKREVRLIAAALQAEADALALPVAHAAEAAYQNRMERAA